MSMQAESLEVLERAHASPELARAIVRAIEIETAAGKHGLATKHDVLLLGTELRGEMRALANKTELADLRGDLKAEIHQAVSGSTRQMYLAVLGQTAVMLGFTYFLVTQLR
ncbi:MAG TPA: hypothetical protein VFX89_10635 [Gammaproteobacteria bacterium]|nr:hypothetical protein [Gammaproteobacteria bacterium]